MNDILRYALIIVGTLVVAVFGLRFLGFFGHEAANTAQRIERKL